jgi:hypothetical protein
MSWVALYPINYILLDSFLVIFIKFTSVNGHNLYNSVTTNAIAELIKLSIAFYFYMGEKDGSIENIKKQLNWKVISLFLAPNIIYAINNNLFHYSVGALPPALFVVSINAIRTILTAALQHFVSGKTISNIQIFACFLLVLAFIFTSLPDIVAVAVRGSFSGSNFSKLLYLTTLYSTLSVAASLLAEKLLKDSTTVMSANIFNYSIGFVLQCSAMCYVKVTSDTSLFTGFNIFWIQLIPIFMALLGLSISFLLRAYDNIVKLMCSSIALLVIHTTTSIMSNEPVFSFSFICGWITSCLAVYFYNKKPNASISLIKKVDEEIEIVAPKPPLIEKSKILLFMGFGLFLSLCFSEFYIPKALSVIGNANDNGCPLYEVGADDKSSSMSLIHTKTATDSKQFSFIDPKTGILSVHCPGNLYYTHADSLYTVKVKPIDWIHVPTSKSLVALPWDVILSKDVPFSWLKCDTYVDVNLAVKPAMSGNEDTRDPLSADQIDLIKKSILTMSKSTASVTENVEDHRHKPVFDTVLILYIDAVSRIKFKTFYKKTVAFLEEMEIPLDDLLGVEKDNVNTLKNNHVAIPLNKYHSLGYNSAPNYLPFMAGIDPKKSNVFNNKNVSSNRELWLFDIAEQMGFSTLSAFSPCTKLKTWKDALVGGYIRQYMQDTVNRLPAMFNWPSSVLCEAHDKPELYHHGVNYENNENFFAGDRFQMSYVYDWTLNWLATHSFSSILSPGTEDSKAKHHRRFGVLISEESHRRDFFTNIDDDLVKFLRELLINDENSDEKYSTGNTALLLLSDHGMHFTDEYRFNTGKIANKQPFGYMILPKVHLKKFPHEAKHLYQNSNMLLSAFDLRTTVINWLTGRSWGNNNKLSEIHQVASNSLSTMSSLVMPYASKYGKSLLIDDFNYTRGCDEAGIPSSFCGCDVVPCDKASVRTIYEKHAQHVADFVNNKISKSSPRATSVCTPLSGSDLHVQIGEPDCMISKKTGLVNVNFIVSKSNALLSITLKMISPDEYEVEDVITSSAYEQRWDQCTQQFAVENIKHNIDPNNWQYCYCKEEQGFWYQMGLKVVAIVS